MKKFKSESAVDKALVTFMGKYQGCPCQFPAIWNEDYIILLFYKGFVQESLCQKTSACCRLQ